MLKRGVILLFLFIIIGGIAYSQDVNEYSNLRLNVSIDSDINLVNGEGIRNLETGLKFYPRDYGFQKVISKRIDSNPKAVVSENENIKYRWDKLDSDKVEIRNNFVVDTTVNLQKVKGKVKFPLDSVEGNEEYLKSDELIKPDDEKVKNQAARLAEGKDDLYDVAYEVAKWTNENINYNLATLSVEAKKDAGWVLENKEGVCSELTVLYISMMRSLGVPAKFVSGVSYTDLTNDFGNHAWAEVYFPGYGWVAFDPTYGQFGLVDAGHVKMAESANSKESSVSYSWKAVSGEVNPGELKINTDVLENTGKVNYNIGVNGDLLSNKVKPGSFVPLEVQLMNNEDFYLPVNVYLTSGPKVIEDNRRSVLLKPGQKKNVFFLIEVPDGLKDNYLYTSEIIVKTNFGNEAKGLLEYATNYNVKLSKEEAEKRINELLEDDNEAFGEVRFNCASEKNVYYEYEDNGGINCKARNMGTKNFNDMKICLDNDCKDFSLRVSEEREFSFAFNLDKIKNSFVIVLTGEGLVKHSYVDITVIEKPDVSFNDLSYPGEINYKDSGVINFTLNSKDIVNGLDVFISGKNVFHIDSFSDANEFNVPFDGSFFMSRKPGLKISYFDRNGVFYEKEEILNINVVNAPWYADVIKFFKGIF